MLDYRGGKLVLAPMVRIGELPTRLMSLKYGADYVWGPELIDKKMLQCKRVWNEQLKSADFLEQPSNKVIFRTVPELERGKLVFQMGTAGADLAVKAGHMVAQDVDAIDVNCGCPKHFSVHAGMGAALLTKPDTLVDILTRLVTEVGKPNNISISAKIRLLDQQDPEPTFELVRRLVTTGIGCLTLHCRTAPMRPREPALPDVALAGVVQICHDAGVACYVNGDVNGRWELEQLQRDYGVDGAMVARAAETNTSCFASKHLGDVTPWPQLAREFVDVSKKYDNHVSNIKFCLTRIFPGKHKTFKDLNRSKTLQELEQVVDSVQDAAAPGPEPEEAKKRPAEDPLENGASKKTKDEPGEKAN